MARSDVSLSFIASPAHVNVGGILGGIFNGTASTPCTSRFRAVRACALTPYQVSRPWKFSGFKTLPSVSFARGILRGRLTFCPEYPRAGTLCSWVRPNNVEEFVDITGAHAGANLAEEFIIDYPTASLKQGVQEFHILL